MKSADAATTLAGLAGIQTIESEEADVDKYAMLSQIEFEHPLLAVFSEPHFGNFTPIHFWKYRRLNIADLPGALVLAWFDSGGPSRTRSDPAWFELHVGKGTLLVLTSGWHPSDSQLALSSKFVPLLYSILEYGGVLAGQQSQYVIADPVPIRPSINPPYVWRVKSGATNLKVRKPDDSIISLDADQRSFTQTDLPGIYAIEGSTESGAAGRARVLFAVNLPVKESQTAAMQLEDLEKLGVSLENLKTEDRGQKTGQPRHSDGGVNRLALPDPGRVFLWRWVFVALLAVSIIEIWLAGWMTGRPPISQGEQK